MLLIWLQFSFFEARQSLSSPTRLDIFLNRNPCGRLIRYPDVVLAEKELKHLHSRAALFFAPSSDCRPLHRPRTVSSEELSYPLAFSILIHANVEQFDALLRTIYREHNHYCVHVDLKAPPELYESVVNRSKCVSNIYLPSHRVNVSWGQFSVLEAERSCQAELLRRSTDWKYYLNLANSDIPLKTNHELVRILKLYNNQNDVTSLPYRSQLRQNQSLSHRKLPMSLQLPFYKGEFHVTLSRSAVEFIHRDSRVADLYGFLNGTSVPDEHFYSMINRWPTTPGYYPHDHDLSQISFMTRYKIWSDRPEQRLCRGGFVRGICVFGHEDLWHLATSPHLFGNKNFVERDHLTSYCMALYLDARDASREELRTFSMVDRQFYSQLANVKFANGYSEI